MFDIYWSTLGVATSLIVLVMLVFLAIGASLEWTINRVLLYSDHEELI